MRCVKKLSMLLAVAWCVPVLASAQEEKEKQDPAKAQAAAKCATCDEAKTLGHGWCKSCKAGMQFGQPVKSEKVFLVIEGEPQPKEIPCADCATAAKADGQCKACRNGFARGHVYHSLYVHQLALGEPLPIARGAEAPKCESCAEVAAAGQGFCDSCEAGVIARRLFKGRTDYDAALAAWAVVDGALKQANTCEECAIAILKDGECTHCKVKYQNGKELG